MVSRGLSARGRFPLRATFCGVSYEHQLGKNAKKVCRDSSARDGKPCGFRVLDGLIGTSIFFRPDSGSHSEQHRPSRRHTDGRRQHVRRPQRAARVQAEQPQGAGERPLERESAPPRPDTTRERRQFRVSFPADIHPIILRSSDAPTRRPLNPQLEVYRQEIANGERQIADLRRKQASYEERLNAVASEWNTLQDDIVAMVERTGGARASTTRASSSASTADIKDPFLRRLFDLAGADAIAGRKRAREDDDGGAAGDKRG